MKKLVSLLMCLLLISGCALAAGSISAGDVNVPSVDFPSADPNPGSPVISTTQPGSVKAEKTDETEAVPAGLGMADVLSALKGDEVSAYEAVEKTAAEAVAVGADFGLTLNVIYPEMPIYSLLQEIAAFTAEAPISAYLGEEAMLAALPLLPEGCDAALLALDELYELVVTGYDPAYGDIEAAFEFVTEYADDTVLLAAVALLPAQENADADAEEALLWLPLQACAAEGRVSVRLSGQALEAVSAHDGGAAFALMQLTAPAED